MNKYLTRLLHASAIDIKHLTNEYLSSKELEYIDKALVSKQNFNRDFYTDKQGANLEVLLFFLDRHKIDIIDLMEGERKTETLIKLYTSATISGYYDCFRFDLSKSPQSYMPTNQVLTLYRIGRGGECEGNLGCSWAKDIEGLNAYYSASGIDLNGTENRPVFKMKIDDSEVLFEGKETEHELVLKLSFKYKALEEIKFPAKDCEIKYNK